MKEPQSKKVNSGAIKAQMMQLFYSKRFWTCMFGIAAVCILGNHEMIQAALKYPDFNMFSSLKQLEMILVFDRYKAVMVAMIAGAAGCGIAEDIRSGRIYEIVSRISRKQYLRGILVTVITGAIFATCLGFWVGTVILRPIIPFRITYGDTIIAEQFLRLARSRLAVLYLFLMGSNFALSAVLPVIAGMSISLVYPSCYVTIGASVVSFYFLYSFSLLLPSSICYSDLSSGLSSPAGLNWCGILLWHLVYWSVLIAVFWKGFIILAGRHFQNGNFT